MTVDKDFESWRQARRTTDVPFGFADRVMARLEQSQQRVRLSLLQRLLLSTLARRAAKATLCLLAIAVCISRVFHVFAIFQVH
jgi:hypothetical protein